MTRATPPDDRPRGARDAAAGASASFVPGPRCVTCGGLDACARRDRRRDEYPDCRTPIAPVEPRALRRLFAWWTRHHGFADRRLERVARAVAARAARDAGRYSEVFEPSYSRDAGGEHYVRFSYAFPGFREEADGAQGDIAALCRPFGRDVSRWVLALAERAADPCVAQPLVGLAYDGPASWRVKVYLQFADGAGDAAAAVAEPIAGRAALRALSSGGGLHLVGVDLGPQGIVGVKLYVRHPAVRPARPAAALRAFACLPALHRAGVSRLVDVLAIHRLRRRDDPDAATPSEIDFSLGGNELSWDALASEPALACLTPAARGLARLAAVARPAVRRVSIARGGDKINLYYVPTGPAPRAARRAGEGDDPVAINRWRGRDGGEEREVVVRLTDRCNLRCAFCQVRGLRYRPSDSFVRAVLRRHGRDPGAATLSLSGGEPTLDPRLPDFVAGGLALPFARVSVQTNALRFADPAYAARFAPAERLSFFVSFHGHTPRLYDAATASTGRFAAAVRGIRNLLDAGHPVILNYVVTRENVARLTGLVRAIPRLFPRRGARLALNLSTLSQFPGMDERAALLPRLTDVLRESRRAAAEARRIGLAYFDFLRTGACALPPCVLTAAERRRIRAVSVAAAPEAGAPDAAGGDEADGGAPRAKPASCRRCVFDAGCGGVPRAYAAVFGLGELEPVAAAED